jgi:hypothetical protein
MFLFLGFLYFVVLSFVCLFIDLLACLMCVYVCVRVLWGSGFGGGCVDSVMK